jgi:D-glycero-D-manno-heptose 1,7-bisphosphate phosphatase
MSKLLLLDLDGTVRQSASGKPFINSPTDQELIPGVAELLKVYVDAGWRVAFCTNQGGVAAGHKTLEQCIEEQMQTLYMLSESIMSMSENVIFFVIYFCPDDGQSCFIVDWQGCTEYTGEAKWNYRKPNPGMLFLAIDRNKFEPSEILYVGDRPEDADAAYEAGLDFMWAHDWLNQSSDTGVELHEKLSY